MIIEIRKAGFTNKGAELMLHAVMAKVKERYPDATLVMAPTHRNAAQPFHKLVWLGFYPKAWLWKFGIQWGDFAAFLPPKLQEMYGLVLDRDIDVVIDAAGFSYSDQWGVATSRELAKSSRRWRRRGTKLIMLPQAFGPFKAPRIDRYVEAFVANAQLVCAREPDSYRYITELVGEQQKIKLYPDFTNLVAGVLPESFDYRNNRVALIPNYRMIDKTTRDESEAYVSFMVRCARYLADQGKKPFILIHEGEKDRVLAGQISRVVHSLPVVKEEDPFKIKGILGQCDATIGSRFHGLVSALSQGVPSLATGWSHKYRRLFEDYGFPEGVVSVLDPDGEVEQKLGLITGGSEREELIARLNKHSAELKERSEAMWKDVFEAIES